MENVLEISHLHGPRGTTEKIRQAMYETARQFVYIGFLLWEVKSYKYYEEGGYQDVYAYAEYELGFKRSSTKNFIAVAETFGTIKQSSGDYLHTMHLQPKYKDFKYSQLVEMLGMSEQKRQQAKPNMTVKQLRELKKTPEPEQFAIEEPETVGQTSGQKEYKSNVINNRWTDFIEPEVIRELCHLAGVRYDPRCCYNIKIERHKG